MNSLQKMSYGEIYNDILDIKKIRAIAIYQEI